MSKNLNFIPRKLNAQNIDKVIENYLNSLENIPLKVSADDILSFLSKIKREKIKSGPYPNVSLFEAGNRIMTDLTILFGVRDLLKGVIPEINFTEYEVQFGNENKNKHDIIASSKNMQLVGEAFNVSESYFYSKKSSTLKKLKKVENSNQILLLLYNEDSKKKQTPAKISENEFHYSVKIEWPKLNRSV